MNVPIGAAGSETITVTPDLAITFMNTEGTGVLSTPNMILWMEMTARNSLLPFLEQGYDSVGTIVDVKHLAATPIGMSVRFRSEVIAVDNRRVTFRVEAFDDIEKVGEGIHERFVVNAKRFAERLAEKRQGGAN